LEPQATQGLVDFTGFGCQKRAGVAAQAIASFKFGS
jgi:hypothetical protein